MITQLTKEQEKQIPIYYKKWLEVGLSTKRINRPQAIKDFLEFDRVVLGNKIKSTVIFMDSPLTAWLAIVFLYQLLYSNKKDEVESQVESQVWSQVGSQVWSQVWSQIESQIESQVESQVGSQVRSQVWLQVWSQIESQVRLQVRSQVESQIGSQVGSQVWSQVWSQVESQVGLQVGSQVGSQVWSQVWSQIESQVGSQVGSQVWSQVGLQVWSQLPSFVYPYLSGHFWAGYFGYYEFMNEVLGIKFEKQKEWELLLKTKEFGFIYPFKDFCVICEKPTQIKMRNGLLHNDNGASVLYADGFSVYSLNGVQVPREIVDTPAEKLNPQLVLKEKNTEVRREIVRKIGIERVCQKLGAKIIDKKGEYELLDLNLGENTYRPYLKMKNPSIGVYHIEGVPRECKTVTEALNSRKPKALRDIPTSENGEDWYQQGDVCVWRKGANFVKPEPTVLT